MVNIEKHILFTFLDADIAKTLIGQAQSRIYQKGDVIFHENDLADDIYLVLEGCVKVAKKDPSGKEQILATIEENDFFGEYAVVDGLTRSASTIVGSEEAVLAKISGFEMLKAFQESGGRTELQLVLHIIRKVRQDNQRKVEDLLRQERNALLGQMASAITHDLKNPTANIMMAISALSKKELTGYQQQLCDMIRNDVDRMVAMEDEILDFARGAPSIKPQTMDSAEIFEAVDRLYRMPLEEEGITLMVFPCSMTVSADKNKILRVLQNLIGNAAEALSRTKGVVVVNGAKKGEAFEITVSDNGPGIPERMQACLFEPFTTMGKSRGTGLGMAVSKSIIEAHQGTLTFQTSPKTGTTFLITLPQ